MRHTPANISRLLQKVSRSFGLSLRLLPTALRAPISLAYLLARIADTIADTPDQPTARRLDLLGRLQQAFQTSQGFAALDQGLRDFAQHVPDPHERVLLSQGPVCLDALAQLPAPDQAAIRQVLDAITEGQRWDLSALDDAQRGVPSREELDRYTWLVAGSVGEFWTRMCEMHLHDWHTGTVTTLMQWGASYGKGLQRLNILRDAGRDLRHGRCYWPAQELESVGLDSSRLCEAVQSGDLATLERLRPLFEVWVQVIQAQLHDGLRYSLALRGWRLRLASALPCLIGMHTLALLRQAGPRALVQHIKVPRHQVRSLLLRLLLGGVSDRQLQRCWQSTLPQPETAQVSARIST